MLCIKLVNYWAKYTEMHGQQNAPQKTKSYSTIRPESETSKIILHAFT